MRHLIKVLFKNTEYVVVIDCETNKDYQLHMHIAMTEALREKRVWNNNEYTIDMTSVAAIIRVNEED